MPDLAQIRFSTIGFSCFLLLCLGLASCNSLRPERSSGNTAKDADYSLTVAGGYAAIASVQPLASAAGQEVIERGGNAIDAAIAVAFALGVVDSHNSGVGGGCFILARLASGEILAIDGREMAPAKAHRDMYLRDGEYIPELSKTGALAAGIPGSVAAYHQLQNAGGKLSFKQVLQPAIELAEQGFEVDSTLANRLAANQQTLSKFPASAQVLLKADGQAYIAGERLIQRDLANSYRQLAEQGPDWFYKSGFPEKVQRWMSQNGGMITAQDFANYHTVLREPIRSKFGQYTILGFPPPSSGGLHVAQILAMLPEQELADMAEPERYHLIAEAMRRAFADRAYFLGDPDYADVPRGLLDSDYLRSRMSDFDPGHASDAVVQGQPPAQGLFNKHTTHIATADRDGNWVAITTTLNTSFGSKVLIPSTGILLNNQMDDFSAQPGKPNAYGLVGTEANSIAAGKRPLSSMSPSLVFIDDEPVMTLGAAGGPTIISQVAQVLINRLALNDSIEQAFKRGRVHHQWRPNVLFVEDVIAEQTQKALSDKGHTLKPLGNFGATQAIELLDGKFYPVTEPRLILRNQAQ